VVATVTIAAYIGLGGLGQYIITGLALRQLEVIIGGALLVAVLALVLDGLFALLQLAVVPRGVRVGTSPRGASVRARRRAGTAVATASVGTDVT
jgi:osmoprotectant transport system permease protein